jgi:TrmH family RNA methyltransferase
VSLIASRDNPRFKAIKRLAEQASARKQSATTILEGPHLCARYLERLGQPKTCVVAQSARTHAEIAAIVERVDASKLLVIEDQLYAKLSLLEHSVALLFVIDVSSSEPPAAIKRDAVLIDHLQDPGNLGSILRSAAAAGVAEIFVSPGSVSVWSPKVLRAAMGAHFALAIHDGVELAALIEASDVPVLATSSHQGSLLFDRDLRARPVAWLFGNEGQGVDETLLDKTYPVRIPQPGGEESLNVAAAAAVCLFEMVRQRG